METVTSSTINAVGYEESNNILKVNFKNGSTYVYQNVPKTVYQEFLTSESKGKFFNRNIRGQYEYQKS